METILATAFGRSVDIQGGESDQIVDISRMFFDTSKEENALSHTMLMPVLSKINSYVHIKYERSLYRFVSMAGVDFTAFSIKKCYC